MSVDLIKALDPRAVETPRDETAGGEGDFPEVFESKLVDASAGDSREDADLGNGSRESVTEDAAEPSRSDAKASDDDAPDQAAAEEDEAAKAEAAAESGAVGGESGRLEERVRIQTEADRLAAERLDRMDSDLRTASEAGDDRFDEVEALDEAQAREAVAQLEAEGVLGGDGDEASAVADAAVTGAVASGVPQAVSGVAQGSAELANELSDDSPGLGQAETENERVAAAAAAAEREADGEQGQAQEEANRPSDEALFERAAEGSAQAAVDPNLRQAVATAEEAQRAPEVTAIDGAPAVASPVAGQVTETTTTATPGSPQPVPASEAISVQTEWLATRGGGTARMVLHPPELGEIAIRVSIRAGAVDVVMVAQEAVAQGVAEEQSERLAQAFANRDLRLEHFEVRRGSAEELAMNDPGRFGESEAERDGRANEDEAGGRRGGVGGNEADEAPMAVPRILTRAPETGGVDLRI